MNISIYRDGQQYGPYSPDEVQAHIASGVLLPDSDLAWHEGLTEWIPLRQALSGLASKPAPAAAPVAVAETIPDASPAPAIGPGYRWTSDKIAPSRMSAGYQLGLALVAVVMILLPLLYLLLCAVVGYGVYLYAANEYGLLDLHQIGIVSYFGPIIAGSVALIFLVKPLFHSRETKEGTIELSRADQPQLFQFIDEVCSRVKAPRPVKVRLDIRANASAGFEYGWLGMIRNRLVLTIGTPLIDTLTVAQLGGVLAHEFGHFTQAFAMRLSYITRSTNAWFWRVIFERDKWDAGLAAFSRRHVIYLMIIAKMVEGMVWLARQFLKLLMRLGHMISAYMMRQMEYDADHYEQEIAGRADFRETFLQLRIANLGWQISGGHLGRLKTERRLVDDVPLLVRRMIATLPTQTVESMKESLDSDRRVAKWYETHPSDFQRLTRSASRTENGVLEGDGPALRLLSGYEALSKKLTLVEYANAVHRKITQDKLIPTAVFLEENSARTRQVDATLRFFGGLLCERRQLFPRDSSGIGTRSQEELRSRFTQCSRLLAESAAETQAKTTAIEEWRKKRANAIATQALKENGDDAKIDLGLPDKRPGTIEQAITDYSAEVKRLDTELASLIQLAEEKLFCFCRLSEFGDATAHLLAARVAFLRDFLSSLEPICKLLNGTRKDLFLASVYVNFFKSSKNKKGLNARFKVLAAGFTRTTSAVGNIATRLPYPLQDGKRLADLNAYFLAGNNQPGPMGQFLFLRSMFDRYHSLYMGVMLELLEAGAGPVSSPESDS